MKALVTDETVGYLQQGGPAVCARGYMRGMMVHGVMLGLHVLGLEFGT